MDLLLPIFAVDHPFDSVPKMCDVEVDQESNSDAAQPHIGQELSFVDGMVDGKDWEK